MFGFGGTKKQTVGFAYKLDMAYAFCDKIDHIYRFYLQSTKVWSGDVVTNGSTFITKTGQSSEVNGSGIGPSTITAYLGTQTTPNTYLTAKTGVPLIYKEIAYLVFPQAFIGDNVRTIPTYHILVGRTSVQSCILLPNYNIHKDIVGTVASSTSTKTLTNANPAYIIYDILVDLLKVDTTKIDPISFSEAAATLYTEKLGLSIIITSAKKAIDWIEEILRYISGTLYFNVNIGKYYLKLLRLDYIVDNLLDVNVDIADDIVFTKSSRASLPNTFTFKYANILTDDTPKLDTITTTNQANLASAGYVKNVEVDLSCINTDEPLALLMGLNFKKMSYPISSLNFKISPLDFPGFQLGEVFTFTDTILTGGLPLVFRVIQVTGDAVKDSYFSIEAVEDIFSIGISLSAPPSRPINTAPTYDITGAPNRIKIFPTTPENEIVKSVIVASTFPNNGSYINNMLIWETEESVYDTPEWKYATVTGITNLSGDIYDRAVIITLENLDMDLLEVSNTESQVQTITNMAYWGAEAISFKTLTKISDTVFTLTGILRGVQDKVTTHSVGEAMWFAPDLNDIEVLPINQVNPTIYVKGVNSFDESDTLSTTYTYTNSIETPYAPNSLRVINGIGKATLQWSPCVRLSGANYRNCDTILAGEDEGKIEGVFNIYRDGVLFTSGVTTTYETFLTYEVDTAATWGVSCKVGSYESSIVTVVVTNANFVV